MMDIKNTISFDEYSAIVNKVVNDCFPDGTYSPVNYELSLRTALILAFAPDYTLDDSDNNTLWKNVISKEANEILTSIRQNSIYPYIEAAIENNINYRIKLSTSGSMSMSDIALSKLFEIITEKVEKIDTSMLTKENMDTMIKAVDATQDGDFAENIVDVMLDKGLLVKSKKTTKGNTIKTSSKKSNNKNITVTSKEGDN